VFLPPPPPRHEYTEVEKEVLDEIVAEIYREHDAQKAREFPD
jgi:hypothetical protein